MTSCLSCGAERSDQDRFCRNCGAMAMSSVGDLVDTHRFNPAAPNSNAQSGSPGFTAPFYAPPAVNVAEPVARLPYQTASLPKRWAKRHFVWLMAILLFSSVALAGIGISAKLRARRMWRQNQEQGNNSRRSYNDDIQNALGFKAGNINDAGYPGIKGIFVESLITDDGPAALADIRAGDVLTDLNGHPVRNSIEVAQVLDALTPDTEVSAKVYREGGIINPRIKIADRAHPPLQVNVPLKNQGYLGVKESIRRCCTPTGQKWGVEIQGVNENSPADLAGLQSGDVITEFNGHAVQTPGEFNRLIRATKPRSKVSVIFYRGTTKEVTEMILGYRW